MQHSRSILTGTYYTFDNRISVGNMNQFINQKVRKYRAQLDELAKDVHNLTVMINHVELSETVSALRNRINEPYMFVIVGEVKAGKSSFINALLDTGKEIAKAAPQPMTDTIQQIIWGEEEEMIVLNPFLKRITQPVEILKEIAIVDTPGTNTIVEKHQEITESFIPGSDLIVFVFESKNPYRQSAWNFLDFIHKDWQKKIIFVMQQKDLMSAEDLQVNMNGVKEQAEKKGIANPVVFAVSAKQELEGQKEESGFRTVREYIAQNITGGKAPYLKLQNNFSTLENIETRIGQGIELRRKQFELDTAFRADIRASLDEQEIRSKKQVELLVKIILSAYDNATGKATTELNDGLSFGSMLKRSFSSIFSKKESMKSWLQGVAQKLEHDLNRELKKGLDEGVGGVADSIQQMAKIIQLKVQNSQSVLKTDHDVFSDIAEKRNHIMFDLQTKFNDFIEKSDNFKDQSLFPDQSNVSTGIATGSGIAVVGIIIAAVTKIAAFDVTGGLLTAIGIIFAGATSVLKKKKVMDTFKLEIANSRSKLDTEIRDQLSNYIAQLKYRIDDNFKNFDIMLDQESKQLDKITATNNTLNSKFNTLKDEIKELLNAAVK